MSDVFLSFAREDRARAELVARALEERGLSVSWDHQVPAGSSWRNVIGEALEAAAAVVVLWSAQSVRSEWVIAEADAGRNARKLIPALIDDVELPLGFGTLHTADLRTWTGSSDDTNFAAVLSAVYGLQGRAHSSPPQPRRTDVDASTAPAPSPLPGASVHVERHRSYSPIRASQIRVFVAHASADKPRLQPVLVTLIDQGFQLWVDKPQQIGLGAAYEARLAADRIQYGQDWRESIRVAVAGADTVLAFWSKDAVNGRREQFHYEVYMGMMQRKLNQCRIDTVAFEDIGMPYTFDHIADLSQMVAGAYHPELDYLMQDMARRRRSWWRFW